MGTAWEVLSELALAAHAAGLLGDRGGSFRVSCADACRCMRSTLRIRVSRHACWQHSINVNAPLCKLTAPSLPCCAGAARACPKHLPHVHWVDRRHMQHGARHMRVPAGAYYLISQRGALGCSQPTIDVAPRGFPCGVRCPLVTQSTLNMVDAQRSRGVACHLLDVLWGLERSITRVNMHEGARQPTLFGMLDVSIWAGLAEGDAFPALLRKGPGTVHARA